MPFCYEQTSPLGVSHTPSGIRNQDFVSVCPSGTIFPISFTGSKNSPGHKKAGGILDKQR